MITFNYFKNKIELFQEMNKKDLALANMDINIGLVSELLDIAVSLFFETIFELGDLSDLDEFAKNIEEQFEEECWNFIIQDSDDFEKLYDHYRKTYAAIS